MGNEFKKERRIYYNCFENADGGEGVSETRLVDWYWLVIDQNREINDIYSRIHSSLAPIVDEIVLGEGIVRRTGLRYKLVNFKSPNGDDRRFLAKISSKKISKNRKLYERVGNLKLADFIADKMN